jgi:hypothetical protein
MQHTNWNKELEKALDKIKCRVTKQPLYTAEEVFRAEEMLEAQLKPGMGLDLGSYRYYPSARSKKFRSWRANDGSVLRVRTLHLIIGWGDSWKFEQFMDCAVMDDFTEILVTKAEHRQHYRDGVDVV